MSKKATTNCVVIPAPLNGQETPYQTLRRFIAELIDTLAQGKTKQWVLGALRLRYQYMPATTNPIYSIQEIADGIPQERQTVHNNTVKRAKQICSEMLSANTPVDGILASNEARGAYDAIVKELRGINSMKALEEKFETGDDLRTLLFILDGNGLNVSENQDVEQLCVDKNKYSVTEVNILYKAVKALFRSHPAPLSEDEVLLNVKKELPKVSKEMLMDCIKGCDNFYEITPQGSVQLVSLKWEYLSSEANKIARILYDYRIANGPEATMTREEILNRYNHLANLAITRVEPLDKNNYQIQQDDHIENMGNANFRYRMAAPKGTGRSNPPAIFDLKKELYSFMVSNNGLATFDSILAFAYSLNKGYGESTVRRYIKEIGCNGKKRVQPTTDKSLYYLHKDYEHLYPGQFEDAYGKGSQSSSAQSPSTRLQAPKPRKTRVDYSAVIKQAAINLYNADNHEMGKTKLAESVKGLWANKSLNNIHSQVFDVNPDLFISKGKGKGSTYVLDLAGFKKRYPNG